MKENVCGNRVRRILKRVLYFFAVSLAMSVIFYLAIASIFSTEEEKRMAIENELIRKEYAFMESNVERLESVVAGLEERDREIYHNIFEAYPPSLDIYSQESVIVNDADSVTTYSSARRAAQRIASIEGRSDQCRTRLENIMKILSSGNVNACNIPCIIPVRDFNPSKAGASTGMKIHPLYKTIRQHDGMDLVVGEQTEVIATADGVVSELLRLHPKEGNAITIDHGNGYVTRYSHLGNIYVRLGQKVKRGSKIALVGNTGSSFAPHLHYEVIFRGRYLEPVHFFFAQQTPQQYRQTMLVALNNGQSMD